MLTINMIFLIGVIAFIICGLGIMLIVKKLKVLDLPNHRSSHNIPTPKGGGIAIVITIILSFLSLQWFEIKEIWLNEPHQYEMLMVLACFAVLALISLYNDLKGLSVLIRLGFHFLAGIAVITIIPDDAKLFPDFIPLLLERTILVLILVWFINLYNFMDGIDGITAIETITIGLGLFLIFTLGFIPIRLGAYGLIIAFTVLAFLFYNWYPAKIFMGDVGSIPLGFILGWLLLKTAYEGMWAGALILPLYYLIDATATLFIRIAKGKKPWQAHREHFYQQLLDKKNSNHAQACLAILKINSVLLFFAVISSFSAKVILMSVIYVVYMLNKFLQIGQPEKSYREIKDEMVKSIKEEIVSAKNNFNHLVNKDDHDK